MGTEPLEPCSKLEESEPIDEEPEQDKGIFRRFFRWIGGNEVETEQWERRDQE